MSEWVRWGVLGNATIARICVIPALQQARNGALHALATSRPEDAGQLFDADPPRIYDDFDALLADPLIDAVYIPLPNYMHERWAIRALEAGKHVLCEKPLACNAVQAQRMADAAAAHDRLLMEGFMYRFHPRSRKIRRVVAAGLLGQIRVIRTAFTFQLEAASDNYRLDPSRGGGALLDAGTYGVSLARWLLNEEPTTVQAEAVYGSSGIDQTMVATLRFASGCLAMVEASFEAALQQTYAVVGSEAAVELPHDAFIPWEKPAHFRLRCGKDPEGQLETVAGVDEYRRMVEHFADAVLGRTSLAYTPDDSVHNMEVLDAIARAARERRPVALQ